MRKPRHPLPSLNEIKALFVDAQQKFEERLSDLSHTTGEQIEQVQQKFEERLSDLSQQIEQAQQKFEECLSDLSHTTGEQIEQAEERLSSQISDLSSRVKDLSRQISSLSHTTGVQIEQAAKVKAKQLAEQREFPFLLFSTVESRQSTTWDSLSNICNYLGLNDGEIQQVLVLLCSSLTLDECIKILGTVCETLSKVVDECSRIKTLLDFAIAAGNLAVFLSVLNTCQRERSKPPLISRYLKVILPFLALVRDATDDAGFKTAVLQSVNDGYLTLENQFLFMIPVWRCTACIRTEIEIDMIGSCWKHYHDEFTLFQFSMIEVKTSRRQVADAKSQLGLIWSMIEAIISMLPGLIKMSGYKIIMLYENSENVHPHKGFHVWSILD